MKKFALGVLIGLLLFPLLYDVANVVDHFAPSKASDAVVTWGIIPSYGLADPLIGNCTKDVSKNGHGWVFVNREYFQCGTIAILVSDALYGENTEEN